MVWNAFVSVFVSVLLFIYQLIGNFGVAIILFTILIRLVTHPLTAQQMKGSQAMQELQQNKKWQEIQKKYAKDKERLAQEQMKLYKELGISPFASCLPTLIQFPIIIGLYQAVIRSLASTPMELLNLTHSTFGNVVDVFKLIPLNSHFLWMNLAEPERLYIGIAFGIPVLAIVVMATTYLQSKLMTPPTTGDGADQAAMMGKMMNLYMPFLMGYLALTLASGLALYFLVSNVIGVLQYALLGKVNWRNLLPSRSKPVNVK